MEDSGIVALFWKRDERAIHEFENKYKKLCHTVALGITGSHESAEECVSDTSLRLWNSIPPQAPDPLRSSISRIVRNLSLKKLRANSALKRGSGFEVPLSELENCIPDNSLDEHLSANELSAQINAFLAALSRDDRVMFIKRYWFSESLSEIAAAFGITEHHASVRLSRVRGKLRKYLKSKEAVI